MEQPPETMDDDPIVGLSSGSSLGGDQSERDRQLWRSELTRVICCGGTSHGCKLLMKTRRVDNIYVHQT
jgi:hypothetical protein